VPLAFDDVLRGVALKAYPGLRSTVRSLRERGARLMIGVPDYETYVAHRKANHPGQPIMSYVEFFRERQQARYAVGKGCFRGCC
jgi:uncharacterized short protein YbdD (DUF466 family)